MPKGQSFNPDDPLGWNDVMAHLWRLTANEKPPSKQTPPNNKRTAVQRARRSKDKHTTK
jgi:hypothetical protein